MPNLKKELIEEFVKKFCNDHNGEVRFLRGIFYDEKDGAEEILEFISQAFTRLSAEKDREWKEKIELFRYGMEGEAMVDEQGNTWIKADPLMKGLGITTSKQKKGKGL